jgi:hypothetical protein
LCIVGSYSPNGSAEVLEKAMGRERERAMEHDMYITFIHEDFDVTNHWNTGTLDLWREPLFLFWQSYLFKPKTCLNM